MKTVRIYWPEDVDEETLQHCIEQNKNLLNIPLTWNVEHITGKKLPELNIEEVAKTVKQMMKTGVPAKWITDNILTDLNTDQKSELITILLDYLSDKK